MIKNTYRDDEGVVCSYGCGIVNTMTVRRLAVPKHADVKTRLMDNRRKGMRPLSMSLFFRKIPFKKEYIS